MDDPKLVEKLPENAYFGKQENGRNCVPREIHDLRCISRRVWVSKKTKSEYCYAGFRIVDLTCYIPMIKYGPGANGNDNKRQQVPQQKTAEQSQFFQPGIINIHSGRR